MIIQAPFHICYYFKEPFIISHSFTEQKPVEYNSKITKDILNIQFGDGIAILIRYSF